MSQGSQWSALFQVTPLRTVRNLTFCICSFCHDSGITPHTWTQAGTRLSGVVFFFWWLSGEVKHIVHLIRWNLKAVLCQLGQDLNTGLEWHNARILGFRSWILVLINCFGFLVCHQLVPHLVPNFPRVPLRNVSWGLGVCAVLVRSVSPCRLVPEVRLFPSPPCAVFGRLPVVCPLFSSSCLSGFSRLCRVCVCVTSG